MKDELICRFDAWAKSSPDEAAIVDQERRFTYRQLALHSTALAHRLVDAGVVPGDIIGFSGARSAEFVVAILAILRAGGVYMPISPELPPARASLLIQDARVHCILRHPATSVDVGKEVRIVDVHLNDPVADPAPLLSRNPDSDRACVLYTSGSTGRPKGVVVRQSSIVRLAVDTNYISLGPSDAVAHVSDTAFDGATLEIWGALLNGGRLIILPKETVLSPSSLDKAIESFGITTLFLTTTLFNRIARARPHTFRRLKWLLFGGETADATCVRHVLTCGAAPSHLVNGYGPTECTTFATAFEVRHLAPDASSVPIGKPISGYDVYVRDDQGRPVAEGVCGELYIGGCGVAEGYLNRPKETAAAFIPDPVKGGGSRMYRTGDLVVQRADGCLEFMGRRDDQVKIRGYRIELGEIEQCMRRHPAVSEAVAVAYPGLSDSPCLGAWVVAREPGHADVSELRTFLAGNLPAFMMPDRILACDRIPLTASGKIDRRQLATDLHGVALKQAGSGSPDAPEMADALEQQLAGIWRDVLGHPPRRLDEDFFDGGGSSLQAVDLQLGIESKLGVVLSPSALIEAPTFRQLAAWIRRQEATAFQPLVRVRRATARPTLVCIHGIFGHIFFVQAMAQHWSDAWGLCALQSRYLDPRSDRRLVTVEEMAAENLACLDEAGISPSCALAGYSFGGAVAYEMARSMVLRGQEPLALVLYDAEPEIERRRWRPSIVLHGTAEEARRRRGKPRGAADYSLPRALHRTRAGIGFAFHMARTAVGLALYRALRRRGRRVPARLFDPGLAHVLALEQYVPGPYHGDMLLIRANDRDPIQGADSPSVGWERHVRGQLTVREVPARHEDLFRPPHVAEVAAITLDYLEQRVRPAR